MTLTPHSIIHGDAYFAYFNKIWGIPSLKLGRRLQQLGFCGWFNVPAEPLSFRSRFTRICSAIPPAIS